MNGERTDAQGEERAGTSERASQPRGRARRQAILRAATELYARDGFRGTALTAIGERVGVSHAGVLYHFGSSENLLLAVLEERDRRDAEHFFPIFEAGGLEALRRLPEVARVNLENPGLAQLYSVLLAENLEPDSPVHAYFVKRRRNVHRMLCALLAAGQARGEIRGDLDVPQKANEILSFMEGAQVQRLLDPERVDLLALYEGYVAALLTDVAAEPPEP